MAASEKMDVVVVAGRPIDQEHLALFADLRGKYPHARIVVVLGQGAAAGRELLPDFVVPVLHRRHSSTNAALAIVVGLRRTRRAANALVVYGKSFPQTRIASPGLVVGGVAPGEVGCCVVDGVVTNMSYGLPNGWSGAVVLGPAEKKLFIQLAASPRRARWFPHEVLNELIDRGCRFAAVTA